VNVSFGTAQKLGFGALVAIMLLGAVFTVVGIGRVTTTMQHKVDTQEVKERHFTQMALRFAMVGSDFHQYRQQGKLREQLPELAQQLNTIRGILAQLHALPLTSTEHEGVTKLKEEEVRFRTALYVFVESGARDPAQETAARAAADIALIIDDAVDRAAYYSYRTSELIESSNRGIVESATASRRALSLAAGLSVVAGFVVSVLLSRACKRHLARAGAGGRRDGQPLQEPVPGEHEPRAPDADERRARHERAPAHHGAHPAAAPVRHDGAPVGRAAAQHHQRHPRHLQDRGRPARA